MTDRDEILQRILSRSEKRSSGCVEWLGGKNTLGYGQITVTDVLRPGRRCVGVHRLVMELEQGRSLPCIEQVNHHCDNPACVNIDHLYIGTQAENMRDKKERGRAIGIGGRRISVEGVIYITITAASKATGMSENAVKWRCRSENYPAWESIGPLAHSKGPRPGRPLVVSGENFRTMAAAAQFYGVSTTTIRNRIKDHRYPEYSYGN